MKTWNIAFAGFRHGHIYSLYDLAKKRKDLRIVGAWEAHGETVQSMKELGIAVTYPSYAALLADPQVEIVAIGNYYAARGKMAIAALKAGKHVIADKPLCTTMDEAKEIARLQAETHLAVGMMLDLRTESNFVTAGKAIQDGDIGTVNNISFNGQHPLLYGERPDWYFEKEKYGGVISDIAIHGIDLVRQFTGSDLEEVIGARCWNFYAGNEPDFLDSAQFVLKLKSGAGVMGDVSYATPTTFAYQMDAYWAFRIWGSQGVLECSLLSDGVTLYKNGEKTGRKLPKQSAGRDYLDEFMEAVENASVRETYSAGMLASMMQTLMVQEQAEKR